MFTGIIETTGSIARIVKDEGNVHFLIQSSISGELRADQSVCHNGVCLTITKASEKGHWVTAVAETLRKSSLGRLAEGDVVNLERSMPATGRFEGHIVQGHVDLIGICQSITKDNGSHVFGFAFDTETKLLVEKGSVAVDGISLTCFDVSDRSFSVAIIPHTFTHTNFGRLKEGDVVNLEFDIVGKYVEKLTGNR